MTPGGSDLFGDDDGGSQQAAVAGSTSASGGPSLTFQTGGSQVTLDTADLQFYLLLMQTTLLAYVTYKEATA